MHEFCRSKFAFRKILKTPVFMKFPTIFLTNKFMHSETNEHVNWNDRIKITATDRFFRATFLPLLPKKITPNQLTGFRFLSIPFILYFFLVGNFNVGTILFILSAFSDALDGALARTTKQITDWGIVNDPVADKLLIGTVSLVVVAKFLSIRLAVLIIFLELCLIMLNYWRHKGKIVQAKLAGKTKMVLQCVGVIALLFFILSGVPFFLLLAKVCLYLAVAFALVSLFVYYSI